MSAVLSFYRIFENEPFHAMQRDNDRFLVPSRGDGISVAVPGQKDEWVDGVVKEKHYIYGPEGTMVQIWIEEDE